MKLLIVIACMLLATMFGGTEAIDADAFRNAGREHREATQAIDADTLAKLRNGRATLFEGTQAIDADAFRNAGKGRKRREATQAIDADTLARLRNGRGVMEILENGRK